MRVFFCMSCRPGFEVPSLPLKIGIATFSMKTPRDRVLAVRLVGIPGLPIEHRLRCTEVVVVVAVTVVTVASAEEYPNLTIHEDGKLRADLRTLQRRHGAYNTREIDTFLIRDLLLSLWSHEVDDLYDML